MHTVCPCDYGLNNSLYIFIKTVCRKNWRKERQTERQSERERERDGVPKRELEGKLQRERERAIKEPVANAYIFNLILFWIEQWERLFHGLENRGSEAKFISLVEKNTIL